MLELNGRLVSKSLIKSGVSQHGEYRIIEFVIERTYNKKKIKVAFTAVNKKADLVNDISFKERIKVTFVPSCFYSEKHNKHFTELKAIEVEKYVPKNKVDIYYNRERLNDSDYDLKRDNQLQFKDNGNGKV